MLTIAIIHNNKIVGFWDSTNWMILKNDLHIYRSRKEAEKVFDGMCLNIPLKWGEDHFPIIIPISVGGAASHVEDSLSRYYDNLLRSWPEVIKTKHSEMVPRIKELLDKCKFFNEQNLPMKQQIKKQKVHSDWWGSLHPNNAAELRTKYFPESFLIGDKDIETIYKKEVCPIPEQYHTAQEEAPEGMEDELKLVRWVNENFPPIDLNQQATHVKELVNAYQQQARDIKELRRSLDDMRFLHETNEKRKLLPEWEEKIKKATELLNRIK